MDFHLYGIPEKPTLLLIIGICLALMIGSWLVFVMVNRKHRQGEPPVATVENAQSNGKSDLGNKLKALMEEKQLFRNKDLRAADVAAELCTNTTYLSVCLNGELNTTYSEFITGYRVRYAQELMRKNPTMRMSQVAEESGFANEKTFLRSFKAISGVTPSEWKEEQVPEQ